MSVPVEERVFIDCAGRIRDGGNVSEGLENATTDSLGWNHKIRQVNLESERGFAGG